MPFTGVNPNNKLPYFHRASDYFGDYPAKLWLSRLKSDFEVSGYDEDINPIPPPLFLRVAEVLICGNFTNKLISNPCGSRIVDNRKRAKSKDMQVVNSWL